MERVKGRIRPPLGGQWRTDTSLFDLITTSNPSPRPCSSPLELKCAGAADWESVWNLDAIILSARHPIWHRTRRFNLLYKQAADSARRPHPEKPEFFPPDPSPHPALRRRAEPRVDYALKWTTINALMTSVNNLMWKFYSPITWEYISSSAINHWFVTFTWVQYPKWNRFLSNCLLIIGCFMTGNREKLSSILLLKKTSCVCIAMYCTW